jgi:hypothetical protein
MSIPGAIFRKPFLYSVIPELEQIDLKIGIRSLRDLNFSNIQAHFQTELSNVTANGGDLLEFYTGFTAMMYISSLETGIINSNAASGTDLSNLFAQKISLLEAAYSNIAPST